MTQKTTEELAVPHEYEVEAQDHLAGDHHAGRIKAVARQQASPAEKTAKHDLGKAQLRDFRDPAAALKKT